MGWAWLTWTEPVNKPRQEQCVSSGLAHTSAPYGQAEVQPLYFAPTSWAINVAKMESALSHAGCIVLGGGCCNCTGEGWRMRESKLGTCHRVSGVLLCVCLWLSTLNVESYVKVGLALNQITGGSIFYWADIGGTNIPEFGKQMSKIGVWKCIDYRWITLQMHGKWIRSICFLTVLL